MAQGVGSSPRARGQGLAGRLAGPRRRFIPACAGTGCATTSTTATSSVHPRVRGDRPAAEAPSVESFGSSPRARGQGAHGRRSDRRRRFIPACAGTGGTSRSAARRAAVHPRVRGDRPVTSIHSAPLFGSSPRARGQEHRARRAADGLRFIPACAGTGAPRGAGRQRPPVHPRVRGDREGVAVVLTRVSGSSPRARGQGGARAVRGGDGRFIPACAGTGRPSAPAARRRPVHPRVRGDRSSGASALHAAVGSSPRARGQASARREPTIPTRFIPACAGTGARRVFESLPETVHPRVRGDRSLDAYRTNPVVGSSPRARGQVLEAAVGRAPARFIPACAGTGPSCRQRPRPTAVHPRVRGDREKAEGFTLREFGSSPRARGQGEQPRRAALRHRFIPACAGTGPPPPADPISSSVHPRVRGDRSSI